MNRRNVQSLQNAAFVLLLAQFYTYTRTQLKQFSDFLPACFTSKSTKLYIPYNIHWLVLTTDYFEIYYCFRQK